jgi:membrane-associated phospholipid phosphatase
MPSQMRIFIWPDLMARGILLSMLLVFSLLAVSLIWSVGQRIDVWAFLFFNLRGLRPFWMDRTLLVFTQLGSGIVAMAIGLVSFFCWRPHGGFRANGRSFPSGHTSQAFFMGTLIARLFHAGPWAVFLLFSVASIIGVTRIYVEAHYPARCTGGGYPGQCLGTSGGACRWVCDKRNWVNFIEPQG